jgi:inorganic triphosphatase YgiF
MPPQDTATTQCAPEIGLTLALVQPMAGAADLAARLARTPLLLRRAATRRQLHCIYFDTPEQTLRRARASLCLCRVTGVGCRPQWRQILVLDGDSRFASARGGVWEVPVPGAALSLAALAATPWHGLDPDGQLFPALRACFETRCERNCWTVRRRDRSVVQVALDLGDMVVQKHDAPICELSLQLGVGQSGALFHVARQLAQHVAVLPESRSRAERGYTLAAGALDLPRQVQLPLLASELPQAEAARLLLREMFLHFTVNLNRLRQADGDELVHQARIGWRRFKSGLRLFGPVLAGDAVPSWAPLQPVLAFLGELRDIDVARTTTLPRFAQAYAAGDPVRAAQWQAVMRALAEAAELKRKSVRYALQEPAVGACLVAITQWLEGCSAPQGARPAEAAKPVGLRHWSRHRIARLHRKMEAALEAARRSDERHRARILAKRLRYGIEALQPLLPTRRARRWLKQASTLQVTLGAQRDLQRAHTVVAQMKLAQGPADFLRGVAAGCDSVLVGLA